MRLVVRRLAEQDLRGAQDWYDARRAGLGSDFRRAIDEALERVARRPNAYPVVYRDVRRCVVRRFPYLVYFVVLEEAVVVLACLHSKRRQALVEGRARDSE